MCLRVLPLVHVHGLTACAVVCAGARVQVKGAHEVSIRCVCTPSLSACCAAAWSRAKPARIACTSIACLRQPRAAAAPAAPFVSVSTAAATASPGAPSASPGTLAASAASADHDVSAASAASAAVIVAPMSRSKFSAASRATPLPP